MTNDQICKYIKNYIEKDKTKSAIMLSAPWGKGKTYFVQNELIPFLTSNGGYQSIVISLYGINELVDISKSIYIEVKKFQFQNIKFPVSKQIKFPIPFGMKKLPSELAPAAKVVGTTVIKGIASHFSINLTLDNLEELFASIDLSNKLIIFEDLERCQLDIIEFLGYVNCLVEQDNVKVLLISNENELIHPISNETTKSNSDFLSNKSFQYLKFKEKTVSDTIQFYGNTKQAIKHIIQQYGCQKLDRFTTNEQLGDIESLLFSSHIDNLRTFTFACQKTFEIFEETNAFNFSQDVLKCIFYSIILFSSSIKCGIFPDWKGNNFLSFELTDKNNPLFRFCYDYIRWHEFDKAQIVPTIESYTDYRMLNSSDDVDLNIIFNYYISSENDVKAALNNINQKLDKWDVLPIGMYGKLANYLVVLHFILDYDFSSTKKKMIANLKEHGSSISFNNLKIFYSNFENPEWKELFDNFINEMEETIKVSQEDVTYFTYEPTMIDQLQTRADNATYRTHRFISLYDSEKLVNMLFQCNAQQIDDFRAVLFTIYRNASPEQFEATDAKFMKDMLSKIATRKSELSNDVDKIILLQLNYLCENLKDFIAQLT